MKLKHKQNQPYGCGLYAVANTIHATGYVTEERLEESKESNNIGQLSKWLQEDGSDVFISPTWVDYQAGKMPEYINDIRPTNEDTIPFLLHVQYNEKSLSHLVGLWVYSNGGVRILDSIVGEFESTTMDKLNERYWKIYALYRFGNVSNGEDLVLK